MKHKETKWITVIKHVDAGTGEIIPYVSEDWILYDKKFEGITTTPGKKAVRYVKNYTYIWKRKTSNQLKLFT